MFKEDDKKNASNYRSISILPTLSKLLEKAVHTQLYANWFGFRLKSSTVTAASHLSNQILYSLDTGRLTGAVFLGLAKAFGTVNHTILL